MGRRHCPQKASERCGTPGIPSDMRRMVGASSFGQRAPSVSRMMSTEAPDWIDPEGIGHPKSVARDGRRSLLGLLCLAGAALACYFLPLRGGYLLLAGLAGQGIANLSQPDMVRADGMEVMM